MLTTQIWGEGGGENTGGRVGGGVALVGVYMDSHKEIPHERFSLAVDRSEMLYPH